MPAPVDARALARKIARRFSLAGLSYGHGTASASEEAAWLVGHAIRLGHPPVPAALAGRRLTQAQTGQVLAIAARRIAERMPLAYLLGEAWLAGRRFEVTPDALVPRSHIAELIERQLPWMISPPRRALDMCTGSGCLAILLALVFVRTRVDAADLSVPALRIARRNIAAHGLSSRVKPVRSDLFGALPAGRRYDLIICNPPYVDARAMRALPPEYRHEPAIGLAGGVDGLDFVVRLLPEAMERLTPRGILVCEIGDLAARVRRRYRGLKLHWPETAAGSGHTFITARTSLDAWFRQNRSRY